jgi:hypothetical protein
MWDIQTELRRSSSESAIIRIRSKEPEEGSIEDIMMWQGVLDTAHKFGARMNMAAEGGGNYLE